VIEMTEQPIIPIKKENNIRVILDASPQLKNANDQIEKLNQEIGKKDELLKTFMAQTAEFEKRKIEEKSTESKHYIKRESEETARLETPEPQKQTYELDPECDVPRTLKGESISEVINFLSVNAKRGNLDSKRILNDLTKKIIHNTKPLDFEFHGDSKLLWKTPLPISEFDSDERKKAVANYNEKLRKNRTENWRVN